MPESAIQSVLYVQKYYLVLIRISIEPHFYELNPDLRLILHHCILSNMFLLFFNEEWLNDNSRVR